MGMPSFATKLPTNAVSAPIASPAPAPAPYGDLAGFGTAKISDETPPKPQPGTYECECTNLVRKPKAMIFEYVVVSAEPGSESSPGLRSSLYRDTTDPNMFGYTAKIALAIAGVDVSDEQQVAASQPYLPAMLAAALSKQPQQAGDITIGKEALIGRRFRLIVTPQEVKTSKTGKTNIDKNTGRPYHKETVLPVTE